MSQNPSILLQKSFLGLLIITGLFLWLTACTSQPTRTLHDPLLVDLKIYFKKKQDFLISTGRGLRKRVDFDSREEIHTVNHPEWSRELFFFKELDLNKPSWKGKFAVQTMGKDLLYLGLDSTLPIRRVRLYGYRAQEKTFDSLRIDKKVVNILSTVTTLLVYKPDSVYIMDQTQTVRFFKPKRFRITAWIIPPR